MRVKPGKLIKTQVSGVRFQLSGNLNPRPETDTVSKPVTSDSFSRLLQKTAVLLK
jgi:hypothetical protein